MSIFFKNKNRFTQQYLTVSSRIFMGLVFNILLAAQVFCASLPQQINFQHPLENKDIVLGEVSSIYQDNQGYMWFGGGNALIRYDGYTFKSILLSQTTEKGVEQVPVKVIADIFEDSEHYIWLSTRTGLLKYDPKLEQLTRIPDDTSAALPITTTDLLQAMELATGELLVSGKTGLFIVDRHSGKYQVMLPDDSNPNSIHSRRVQASHIDGDGTVWLGTEAGLEKLDWATKTFTLYKPYPQDIANVSANSVTDIVSDKLGNLWLATANGLVYYNPKNQNSTRYVNDPTDSFSLSGNDIWSIYLDSQNALWIAADGGGISVFEKDEQYPNGRFSNHKYEAGRSGALNSNQVRVVYGDKTGDIWVGNYPDGINYFDRSSAAITTHTHSTENSNSISYNSVLTVRESADGNLWLGTDGGGLNFFDTTNNTFTHYKNNPTDPNSISSNAVLTAFIDSKGDVWTGSWGGGISRLNPTTGQFTRYPFDELRAITTSISTSTKLNNAHVWSIKEDKNNNLWITTHAGGLSKFDRESNIYTHYTHQDNDPNSHLTGITWDTFEDSSGRFWVATSSGLELMDRDSGSFKHFLSDTTDATSLSNPSVLSIFEDSHKNLWLGTDSGLNRLNEDGKTFTRFTKADGFNNDTIRQIIEDKEGNLWLSTNNGISIFNIDSQKIRNYNRDSGKLMGGFHTDSGLMTQKGEIVFGGIDGLRFFNPEKMKENNNIPPVVLTNFTLFADPVAVNDDSGILKESISSAKTITLDYKKSMFSFEFSALNFRDSGKNQYAYKLEGFDDNWLQVGDQRSAKYTNLNAGTYIFKVKGSNNDGVWNEDGAQITIIQLPPPWKTWWAYALYLLVIISTALWFIHHQRAKRKIIEQQNRWLETKVEERTAEIKEKNKDIQAMLENMPQGLFTIQTGEIIHPEYSHFLEEIFERKDIAGKKASELLFHNADIGSDALDSVNNAIFAIIDEDEMNYAFNNSLLISDYSLKVNNKTKYLSLDWNPIIHDGMVNKLMVSVRDVTQLKEMESEAKEQKRELDIIRQLLNISAEKVLAFEESSARYINENALAIESTKDKDELIIALLFRNMHTIKGNCRTYGFTYISDVVHEVESSYSALKSSNDMLWNEEKLLNDLERVKHALAEYADVYRRVLGRGKSEKGDRHDGFWMTNAVMKKIEGHIFANEIEPLKNYVNRIQSAPLEHVLTDVVASLSSIAEQLQKPTPIVVFNKNNIRIKKTGYELITDIFAHILRNCVDHGIEPADERIQKNKDERGKIMINAMIANKELKLFINDDGKGIDLTRLFEKGMDIHKWDGDSRPSNQEIAELVFCSGVSTKTVVTDISGRGVGMDAVKQFLVSHNGNVNLILQNTKESTEGFVPFEILINLPEDFYVLVDPEAEVI
ncbi:MAG: two-component regulator propeller domain-containing protein [Marinagarivorans sp.]|nr:two-component regulator propeller domain-containing protein [Marinagarivorans sp.]